MNTFVQKTTALTIASILTLTLFTITDASQAFANEAQLSTSSSVKQHVHIVGKRMTTEQKLQFDQDKSI
jgi:hypothetical protein